MMRQRPILRPPALRTGDYIAVIAPSLPLLPEWQTQYDEGITTLSQMGFTPEEGQTIGLTRWWGAGTPQQQAHDINMMFANPAIKAIIAHAGGFSALSVLDYLDYDLIRANPKPFLGMSDSTIYHLALLARCRSIGFHTDMLTDGIGAYWSALPDERRKYLSALYQHVLMRSEPVGALQPAQAWETWRLGHAQGMLIGGNLKRLTALAATPYFPPLEDFDGAILFWEEIGREIWDLAMDLRILRQCGIFGRISGMLVGTRTWINQGFRGITYPTVQEIVLEEAAGYDFPIMAGAEFGHHTANIPMPIGIDATLDTATGSLAFVEAAVR